MPYIIKHIVRKFDSTVSASVVGFGEYPISGSPEYTTYLQYKGTWGILVASGSTGAVSMSQNGPTVNLADIATGTPIVCTPSYVSCSAGAVYLLG